MARMRKKTSRSIDDDNNDHIESGDLSFGSSNNNNKDVNDDDDDHDDDETVHRSGKAQYKQQRRSGNNGPTTQAEDDGGGGGSRRGGRVNQKLAARITSNHRDNDGDGDTEMQDGNNTNAADAINAEDVATKVVMLVDTLLHDNDLQQQLHATVANELPPPRLMITKLQLENFKSYAGIQEIGPFHSSFSSVVGPNGSGKSNVIDALLFVFGKRAKKLRLHKVSELIHKSNQTVQHPPAFARVSVYFHEIRDRTTVVSAAVDDGTGDNQAAADVDVIQNQVANNHHDNSSALYDVIPNSEIVLTRTARSDNSSFYQINGRQAPFKEVAAFLQNKGIDLNNNRFLILQGEVELISMMPPKGRKEGEEGLLEYLEEIIGSTRYVDATDQAAAALEALTEQRQGRLLRVRAVEKEKDSLTAAKLEAEALLSKDREIRRKKNILYQKYCHGLHHELTQHEGEQGQLVVALQAERDRIEVTKQRMAEIDRGLFAQRQEYKKIHDELIRTKEEFNAYERRDIKLREDIKHANAQGKKLQAKIESEGHKASDALAKAHAAEESLVGLQERIEQLTELKTEEKAKLEAIHDEIKNITQDIRVDLEEKTQALAPVQRERASYQVKLETAGTEVKLLQDSTKRAQAKLHDAEQELAALDEKEAAQQEEFGVDQAALARAKERLHEAQRENQQLAEQDAKLVKRCRDLLARSEEAKVSLQSKGTTRSPALNSILQASRNDGELSKVGVLGRLGDLATIDEKYDVAVSTACGMLDHVVVQTTAGAQRCLEFLRKNQLGRANFIPLDKMKKGAHDRIVQTPEGAPRLLELIAPSNFSIFPALFLAVGDTLVAPDLETATRWAYEFGKRWRVVTLDGKLIETAGTMSGGGKNARRGGMKLTNSRSMDADTENDDADILDCKQLEEEAVKAQQLLQACKEHRKRLETEIQDLQKTIKALEKKIPKLEMSLACFDTSRRELVNLIPDLRAQSDMTAQDTVKLQSLQERVVQCRDEMAACADLSTKLESEVEHLQKSILDAGGSKLKKQEQRCEKIQSDLRGAEKALSSARVSIPSLEKAAAKAARNKADAEKLLEECQQVLEQNVVELESLKEDAKAVAESFEQVKQIEAQKHAELEAATNEYDELNTSQSKMRCTEIDLVGKIDAVNKQIVDLRDKKGHWTAEIDKLVAAAEEDEYSEDCETSDDEEEDGEAEVGGADLEQSDLDQEMPEAGEGGGPAKRISKTALPILSPNILDKYSEDEIKRDIKNLEAERNTLAKNANMGAIAEYRKKEADYLARVTELDKITEQRNTVRRAFEDLRRKRLEMFMDGFSQITLKLKEMYQMITLGGDAELELVDSLDPFSEGIVFSVRPPKKSWKNISNLSGGEKTLSSLALVFALHHYKPTPLYVMDEIDAALDFKNVSIVANYIKERTKNAQFIIISLRNNMFELADRLVGIYKINNGTKSVTINPYAFGIQGQQNGHMPPIPAFLVERPNNLISQQRPSASAVKDTTRKVSFSQVRHSDPTAAASFI